MQYPGLVFINTHCPVSSCFIQTQQTWLLLNRNLLLLLLCLYMFLNHLYNVDDYLNENMIHW